MKRHARIALTGLAAGLLAALLFLGFDRGFLRFNYPSRDRYPVQGVDVSHHQGTVDWPAVRAEGMAFAYLKATEGGDFVDKRFRENWSGARAAGLAVGAYHFFTFCRDGLSQARNFVMNVPSEADALPPAVDLEFGGNCAKAPSDAALEAELKVFLEHVRQAFGREPVLYVTREFYEVYGRRLPMSSPLWARDVFHSPGWLDTRPWTFWQFGNRGRVRGVTGPVDLNVFVGDLEAWERFRRGHSSAPESKP